MVGQRISIEQFLDRQTPRVGPKLTDRFHVHGITRRGIGASDKPSSGYTVQRSADDVLEVLDRLKMNKPILVGYSCGGQVLNMLGSQHSDRLGGLVYFDSADDPTLTPADYESASPIQRNCRRRSSPRPRPITARSRHIDSPSDEITASHFLKLNGGNSSLPMRMVLLAPRGGLL